MLWLNFLAGFVYILAGAALAWPQQNLVKCATLGSPALIPLGREFSFRVTAFVTYILCMKRTEGFAPLHLFAQDNVAAELLVDLLDSAMDGIVVIDEAQRIVLSTLPPKSFSVGRRPRPWV